MTTMMLLTSVSGTRDRLDPFCHKFLSIFSINPSNARPVVFINQTTAQVDFRYAEANVHRPRY